MKRILALLICAVFLLAGCGKEVAIKGTTTSTTEQEKIPRYPGDAANGMLPEYADLLPDEIFTTTGEENGLMGQIYLVTGFVERYIEETEGYPIFIEISTINGNVIIVDMVEFLRYDTETNQLLTEAGLKKLRDYYPLPTVGEYVVILAEYQGMSDFFECPFFVYGTSDYMVDTVLKVAMISDSYIKADALEDSSESTSTEPAITNPPTITPSATEPPATKPPATEPPATEPPATEPPATEPPATDPPAAEPSVSGNAAAVEKAKIYLKSMAFSRAGLIGQLEYEGFSTEDATYAADNCGAVWNEQAVRSAQSYLNSYFFSYSGLIAQLEFGGFTHDQAVYGADNSGADWNEQAKKGAATYLSSMSFTRDALIQQLMYSGFTYEQAVYGVEANGL